jgi:RimJ/RimL family protein N-acetyltransferase
VSSFQKISLTPFIAAHIEGVWRGVDIVAREKKYLDKLQAAPLEESRDYLLTQIAKGEPFFVAIASEEVVGWCDIRRRTGIASHVGLLNIAIVPGFRGQGIGRKLLLAVLDEAKRTGFVRIELWAHSDNARAIALYEKVGFVREGLLRATGVIDGEFIDSVVMAIINADNAARACATN